MTTRYFKDEHGLNWAEIQYEGFTIKIRIEKAS